MLVNEDDDQEIDLDYWIEMQIDMRMQREAHEYIRIALRCGMCQGNEKFVLIPVVRGGLAVVNLK